ALLHAGRPEGERHHADQEALRQQVEAERKAQESDLIEWSGEGHHGEHCSENDDQRSDGKDERLPAVTIASGLFRHRSSPSRSAWPPSSYQLRHLLQKVGCPKFKPCYSRVWIGAQTWQARGLSQWELFRGNPAMLNEFKEFALRGNVMDMAVGIIIGAA